ncbi:MAG: argR [Firmicutes bacterium]|nr:argR [Bacillota bacterium]
MKSLRHVKLEQIVEHQRIVTQADLMAALKQEGIEVTQATLSRDIRELMLIKVGTADGGYRYAILPRGNLLFSQSYRRIVHNFIVSFDYSGTIIVCKVLPGAAKVVAMLLDMINCPEVIGSVAGNDTVFVTVNSPDSVERVVAKFKQ